MRVCKKITPFLWFDKETAAKFYTSIFKKSKITKKAYYDKAGAGVSGMPKGAVMKAMLKMKKLDIAKLRKAAK